MNIQIFVVKILLITFLLTSCSFLDNKNYNSNNIDDFCLSLNKFKKNYKGMTREQIIYIFGNPIISDTFSDTYHYIFCKPFKEDICQKKILNIFFKKDKVFYFSIEKIE
ncbi:outer membrane protein assembly factor BamE [Buchnera aphidicola (Aphis helianthi)]|uniref:Outer membrane protein assembly factor BamE n=1 Tax=Buchnera aphidicola (Aphis helianthi) TaxID=2315802 RepID=A0A4D6XQ35_9GAMM|nr:outer membrane protein assembly factor BamE [Buchnera aphidicola]QCI17018.1 outer membrane protein assembly factor BamE [Buchnera aphidicola (Aphis helianthi)]